MNPMGGPERRRNVRYIVGGQVIFHTGSPDSSGDLVNLGRYGMLVRTNVRVPAGTQFRIAFTVDGYATPLRCESQVVGIHSELLAMQFLDAMAELAPLLQWLDQENSPWTGVDTPESGRGAQVPLAGIADSTTPEAKDPDPALEAILPFVEAMG